MIPPLLGAALLTLAQQELGGTEDFHRQFDFWIGEWSVQNRDLQPDGSWLDIDRTRARITPVCGNRAILEEWAGPLRGSFMNGFSLRAWDPTTEDWNLVLFWTTDGNASFGTLRGTFRHGRGEFFAGRGTNRTRYTFSDALPSTVRWDSSTTKDGGLTWRTDWIMEFTRTRAADEVTEGELFRVDWNAGQLSPHAAARGLDWLRGEWRGKTTDLANDVELEARLRTTRLVKDCLVLESLQTRTSPTADWKNRLTVRGFVSRRGAWEAWSLTDDDTVLRRAIGNVGSERSVFEEERPDGSARRETIVRISESEAAIEVELRQPGASDFELVSVTELWHAR